MARKDTDDKLREARLAAGLPGRAKLIANLERIGPEDRARAGITQEMIDASMKPEVKKGVEVTTSPWAATGDSDVEEQVRVLDHDDNVVLFSGTRAQFTKLKKALKEGED